MRFRTAAIIAAIIAAPAIAFAQTATPPTPPAKVIDECKDQPSNTITVQAGNLQSAIDIAPLGSTILVPPGATFGAIRLPAKSGSGCIWIATSGFPVLPGNRVTPADAPKMAKIQVSTTAAITVSGAAHHYRLVGLEISVTSTLQMAVVDLANGGPSTQPHHIIIDRCYVHGTASGTHRRGITLHGAHLAVIDSDVREFHESGADSQAVVSWDGTGPLLIQNNYLSASGENVMTGGADPSSGTVGPSDVSIVGNYIQKLTAWKGTSFTIKNLLELKNVRRALILGNVLENNWAQAQNGMSILITPRNQDGSCGGCGTQDITFRANILINGQQGINLSGEDDVNTSTRTARVWFEDNRFDVCCVGGADGKGFQTIHGPSTVTFNHNTWLRVGTQSFHEDTPRATGFVFTNNIIPNGEYGLAGTNTNTATTLTTYFVAPVWTGNALVGSQESWGFPAGNFYPTTVAAATMNGMDGRPVGLDPVALAAATACTVSGQCAGNTPPPDPVPVPTPVPTPTPTPTPVPVPVPVPTPTPVPVPPPAPKVDAVCHLAWTKSANSNTVTWKLITDVPASSGGKPCATSGIR